MFEDSGPLLDLLGIGSLESILPSPVREDQNAELVQVPSSDEEFFTSRCLPIRLNANFVVLILKILGAQQVEDYRPIILGNFVYKLVTKILASRLEGITCLSRRRSGGNMAIKVDIRKAFDTLRWDFLLAVLRAWYFAEEFGEMIASILHSTRLSILVDRISAGYFGCS